MLYIYTAPPPGAIPTHNFSQGHVSAIQPILRSSDISIYLSFHSGITMSHSGAQSCLLSAG